MGDAERIHGQRHAGVKEGSDGQPRQRDGGRGNGGQRDQGGGECHEGQDPAPIELIRQAADRPLQRNAAQDRRHHEKRDLRRTQPDPMAEDRTHLKEAAMCHTHAQRADGAKR